MPAVTRPTTALPRNGGPSISLLADKAIATPFLKWAGGKGRLIEKLEPLFPGRIGRYFEPFVGSGAVFFHLRNLGRLKRNVVLNDLNPELMNCYRVLQSQQDVGELVALLREYSSRAMEPEFYYRLRALDRCPAFLRENTPVQRAARTIFLNHTCYNGLYRVNSSGWFNVPYSRPTRLPHVFREDNLWACHSALQCANLMEGSFDACLAAARPGDFVYLDPPYDPPSPTSSFTTYNGGGFHESDQRHLASVFRELDKIGCQLMLSNSATAFIEMLYKGFRKERIAAFRAIGSRAHTRRIVEELVVTNY